MRRTAAAMGVLGFCGVLLLGPASPAPSNPVSVPQQYQPIARALEAWLTREVAAKRLPALSVALVEDQAIVWARGFGHADREDRTLAGPNTVYRVGSVSKPFTVLALMLLVEQGLIDLDAPVTRYLPDFRPHNPFGKAITLRHLLTHRSGLVPESPVGNYFDPTEPSLARTVQSLNETELLYELGTKMTYSNAGVAVVGYVLEKTQKEAYAPYLKRTLLDRLGMRDSGFEPTPALRKKLAAGTMWTYCGREFPAPTFELGMAPAGCMYSTVNDLGRFLGVLFAGGRGPQGPVVKAATLEQMYTLQFAKPDEKRGFGLGFFVSEFEGRRRVGHGGAIYGFATELAALPDDKLGVVVIASKDVANAVTTHVADVALRLMLAARQGKPLPAIVETKPVPPEETRRLAGRYRHGDKAVDLLERGGKLWVLPARGGFRVELRATADGLLTDDLLGYGTKVMPDGTALRVGEERYERVTLPRPEPAPAKWAGLIGEYGWDHNTLYILERDGKLHALIEWFFLYPLEQVSADVYRFPDFGLYPYEKLTFTRGPGGRATKVVAANVTFPRRPIEGEDGATFTIRPVRAVADLRREALATKPPAEKGEFRRPDLVDLAALDPTLKLDIRYATANNFLGTPLYTSAKAYLQRPAAEALVRAHRKLAEQGYGLLIHDAYRPWYVTKMFWDATPPRHHVFVADPAQGSRHNRGCAVDLTLYDRQTGKPVVMVGGYDEFSDRSYPDYLGGTSLQRWHRDLLRRAMEAEGFTVYEAEWWHFDYRDWRHYPILNQTFEQLATKQN
jgi:CubicO group peptidase (beta-lactamase class C family)/D-alanyl-D-alanine dipeptidase